MEKEPYDLNPLSVEELRSMLAANDYGLTAKDFNKGRTWQWHGPEPQYKVMYSAEPDPVDFRIPKGEVNQIYELRRMFRLF
jgi:hypothetical protein